MLKLGVNIDHVATLRQARYRDREETNRSEPDPVAAALACERAGCHGITAHLREDRRHIVDSDVVRLRRSIQTRLNLEMANTPAMLDFALAVRPDIVCLVPERREEVTTEGGLAVAANLSAISETRKRLGDAGIDVSLFIAPDALEIDAAAQSGAGFIELHTGAYAEAYHQKAPRQHELERLIAASTQAHDAGLKVNAGHGLNLENLGLIHLVPHLVELNIGHSIISQAVFTGIEAAVRDFLSAMDNYNAS
jgi:pyridoxine 5-phosphate synthase